MDRCLFLFKLDVWFEYWICICLGIGLFLPLVDRCLFVYVVLFNWGADFAYTLMDACFLWWSTDVFFVSSFLSDMRELNLHIYSYKPLYSAGRPASFGFKCFDQFRFWICCCFVSSGGRQTSLCLKLFVWYESWIGRFIDTCLFLPLVGR